MPSFREYVFSFVNEDCARGELARDLFDDCKYYKCCPNCTSYASIKKHILDHHRPCEDTLRLLEEMYRNYLSNDAK